MADDKKKKMSASEAGQKGAEAQPTEDKAKGGKNSHGGGRPKGS